jgi:hypothetical protein
VDHRDLQAGQLQLEGLRRAPGHDVRPVVVAGHDVDRRELGELVQHARYADVTGMQDHIGVPQVLGNPRRARLPAARRVRVRQHDDSQFHCSLI